MSIVTPQLLDWVQDASINLGFLEVAPVPLIAEESGFSTYREWIDQKQHFPLDYMARNSELRRDPSLLGHDLKSAFVFLHPYPHEFSSRYIARYAWGNDYHVTIKSKLRTLLHDLQESFGPMSDHRICVDTAPLLERSLAQRSGLGWIGKNGCLISKKHGSFFLIGTLLTSYTVTDSLGLNNGKHCGTCTRCLDACPTDAFIRPGLLDAEKCLSTQTIENRGTVDDFFIGKMKEQAFGCDICQEVCPWNRKTTPAMDHEFLPSLKILLTLPEQNFRSYFRKTPLERPTWAGLKRNFLLLGANDSEVPDQIYLDHLMHQNELVKSTAQQVLDWRKTQNLTVY